MKIDLFQINAFTNAPFSGNPAAVCPLKEWIPPSLMQSIATEINLSETAFFVKKKDFYELRWFTPSVEVDLCGHGTLAAAFVIFKKLEHPPKNIIFKTKSGDISVKYEKQLVVMDFPSKPAVNCKIPEILIKGLRTSPIKLLSSIDYIAIFNDENEIKNIKPNFDILKKLPLRGVIITSKSSDYDFVSRFFGPKLGINEDPVTGSAHCILTPYWAAILNKKKLHAAQLSKRSGELFCEINGDRVLISGTAIEFFQGTIFI